MLSGLVITFRETLEAALIIGIILSYLIRTKQLALKRHVYWGIAAGILASAVSALLFQVLAGGFSGRTEELFEGATMLVGAALLTTLILWMLNQDPSKKLKKQVAEKATTKWGIFTLVFISILREGIETVIFLASASLISGGGTFTGAVLGILIALSVAYLLFQGASKLPLRKFFMLSNVVLILFAAGLVANGVHELQEGGAIPIVTEHVYDINPDLNPDGSFPLMHEKGVIGSILKGLVGYNGNPSLIELMSYGTYLTLVGLWILRR